MNGGKWDNRYVRALEGSLGEHNTQASVNEFKEQCSVLKELKIKFGLEENTKVDTKFQ